ncbi:hypothetical protein EDD85DRAFT_137973 [Armillaria nabsnona]|nr:hypothetical protein EDD85DRAFT_137973 [Armillaria nabsnona]
MTLIAEFPAAKELVCDGEEDDLVPTCGIPPLDLNAPNPGSGCHRRGEARGVDGKRCRGNIAGEGAEDCRNQLMPVTERTPTMALIAEFPPPDEIACDGEEGNFVPPVTSHPSVMKSPRFKQSLAQTNPMLQRFGTPGNSRQKKTSKLVILPRLLYRRIHFIDWLIVERIQICCFRPDPLTLGRATVMFLFYNLWRPHVFRVLKTFARVLVLTTFILVALARNH